METANDVGKTEYETSYTLQAFERFRVHYLLSFLFNKERRPTGIGLPR